MTGDRSLLVFRQRRPVRREEIVAAEQPAVRRLDPRARGIRITARRLKAVQQARHDACRAGLHHRPT